VHSVSLDKDHQLQVQFCLASNTQKFTGDPIPVDRLIVCGGWQPDLRLWHGVGGKTKWNITTEKLQAIGEVSRVILAGSCLGLQAMTDCWNSGQNAINSMLQKDKNVVFVPTINPEYESADGQLPISNSSANSTNCYLDSGHSLTQPSLKPQTGFWKKLFSTRQKTQEDFSQTKGENTLVDVAAKVELGELPAQFAGSFAQERCGVVADLQHSTPNVDIYSTLTNDDKGKAPSYLSGRFGRKEHIVRLKLSGNFGVEVGNFVFRDHGESSPLAAIGSIFEIDKNDRSTALALLDTSISGNQTALIVRHGTAATHARIETPES
ncbi:MAG: hypothetical protein L3J13_01785, partial [Devosiaceae bacterium]|nr:hypothetical protein [Devosiaceae bacterium]